MIRCRTRVFDGRGHGLTSFGKALLKIAQLEVEGLEEG
jgi:hypothetical protein